MDMRITMLMGQHHLREWDAIGCWEAALMPFVWPSEIKRSLCNVIYLNQFHFQ